jgi:hypothetical protein
MSLPCSRGCGCPCPRCSEQAFERPPTILRPRPGEHFPVLPVVLAVLAVVIALAFG